jgi:hypothetical protein
MGLVDRSLRNIASYARNQPLEVVGEDTTITVSCEPPSAQYEREFIGSLWAIQSAWYSFRDDEHMLREIFVAMRESIGETHEVLLSGKVYDWFLLELLDIARRSETFKTVLLDQKWLAFSETDIGGSKGTRSS